MWMTWMFSYRLYGVPSDHYKTAAARVMMTARTECLISGRCNISDYRYGTISIYLFLLLTQRHRNYKHVCTGPNAGSLLRDWSSQCGDISTEVYLQVLSVSLLLSNEYRHVIARGCCCISVIRWVSSDFQCLANLECRNQSMRTGNNNYYFSNAVICWFPACLPCMFVCFSFVWSKIHCVLFVSLQSVQLFTSPHQGQWAHMGFGIHILSQGQREFLKSKGR